MAPSFCSVPGCSTRYKKGHYVYIKLVKSLKFLKKDTDEYQHQELLNRFVLSYRNPNAKEDNIKSQIHRGQCGICEKHFKTSDFILSTAPNGKKCIKVGAIPTECLPEKSVPKQNTQPRREIVKHPLPTPVVHRDFNSICASVKKQCWEKSLSDWNFTVSDSQIVARYKTDVSSILELVITANFSYKLFYHGFKCLIAAVDMPDIRTCTIKTFLQRVLSELLSHLCSGFSFNFKNAIRHVISTRECDDSLLQTDVYRSPSCPVIIVGSDGDICKHCKFCISMNAKLQRQREAYNFQIGKLPLQKFSTRATKSRLLQTARKQKSEIAGIKQKLSRKEDIVALDSPIASDIHQLMERNSDSFYSLFYSEQLKMQKQRKNGLRFHPDIVRFALNLAMKSASCYDELRRILILPSRRTLIDYRNAEKPATGWTSKTAEFIRSYVLKAEDKEKCVYLTVDEMSVKQDLVYDACTGTLVGFTDLGNRSNPKQGEIATHALTVYVKSFSGNPGLKFPLLYFASTTVTGSQLASIMWECIGLLETHGLQVLAIVADGLAANRTMFKLMSSDGDSLHQAINWFSPEMDRKIYLIPDPPHLLKTTRNCLFSSSSKRVKPPRLIHRNGKFLLWEHFALIESENKGELARNRLSARHIQLTSYSKMNVKLAAQTLSASVATAMKNFFPIEKREEMKETADFVSMMDSWFDYMNTRPGKGKRSIRVYSDIHDDRLSWLENIFIPRLEQWREANMQKFGRSSLEKSFLSKQTFDGLRLATKSMVELVRYLLNRGFGCVATRRISQDSLEAYFGHQRALGRRHQNPNIHEFGYRNNTIVLKRELHHGCAVGQPLKKRRKE